MVYVKEDEFVKNNIKISKAPFELNEYDMYYIKFQMKDGKRKIVRTFCEKNTFPNFGSKQFQELVQVYGKNITVDFFVKRLIGPQGLMAKEGRDDYIYLGGELCKNGYLATRYMIQENGKTGQQNFDANLFRLKLQVESKEKVLGNNKQFNNRIGKTYVTGDIHGMYGSYMDIMKKMTSKDKLIILGDVIDRGAGGIQIIQDILRRKQDKQNNPEIVFLLGNHEMQFLDTVAIMIRRNLNKKDLSIISYWKYLNSQKGYCSLIEDKQGQAYWQNELNKYDEAYKKLIREKGIADWELEYIGIWINSNHGNKTIFDFLEGGRVKDVQEQNEIVQFLLDSYVILPQTINNRDYLFVHAVPPKNPRMLQNMKQNNIGYKYKDLTREQYSFMLEERDDSAYAQAKQLGFTTICGHTPEIGTILRDDNNAFVRIDAGCGHKNKKSKLALYCVDDNSVLYFDEKETPQEQQMV